MSEERQYFDIEELNDVTIAKFIDKKIMDEDAIQLSGKQLFALVDTSGRRKIIVDFSSVEYMTSLMLNKLITLHKKMITAKGALRLCNIRADIYEVFQITRLNRMFVIKENQEKALEGL